MGSLGLVAELWAFLRTRRKWWLLPLVVMLLLLGAVLFFASTSPLGPFIYTIF